MDFMALLLKSILFQGYQTKITESSIIKITFNDRSADHSIRTSFNSVESRELGTTWLAKGFIPQPLGSS